MRAGRRRTPHAPDAPAADTIVALATAVGVSAVGVVRLSGPRAIAIASTIVHGRTLLEQFVATTPGAFIEKRAHALVWRYQRANAAIGQSQAQTLAALLRDAADPLGYEVITAAGSVEVRPTGLSLARTVRKVIDAHPDHQVVFVGTGDAAVEAAGALRPSDILVDCAAGIAGCDVRRPRTLLGELADALAPTPRAAFPLHPRLRTGSRYAAADLNAVVTTRAAMVGPSTSLRTGPSLRAGTDG